MKTKQIIVIRRDLKMRRGKEISQGAHASMMFLIKNNSFQKKNKIGLIISLLKLYVKLIVKVS
jgi:peptidyl-tRNA hydrolase